MSKIKIVLLSLLAVTAVGVVASSQASAHEYLVNAKALAANETKEVEAVSTSGYLETIVAGNSVALTCQDDYTPPNSGRNWIGPSGTSKALIDFTNCFTYIYKEGKKEALGECKPNEPIEAEATDSLTGAGEDTFTGSKGAEELFSTIVYPKNEKCLISKTFAVELKIKGKQVCTTPTATAESVVHEVICVPGGSTLKNGAESAKLWTVELLKLRSAEPWSAT